MGCVQSLWLGRHAQGWYFLTWHRCSCRECSHGAVCIALLLPTPVNVPEAVPYSAEYLAMER